MALRCVLARVKLSAETLSVTLCNRRRLSGQLVEKFKEKYGSQEGISVESVLQGVRKVGLCPETDLRLEALYKAKQGSQNGHLETEQFFSIVKPCLPLIDEAIDGHLVVPKFKDFTAKIDAIYSSCGTIQDGKLADYIPLLANVDPALWGVSLCTIDGQRHDCGDAKEKFSIQSAGKAFNYGFFNDAIGREELHKHIGKEPSGLKFNEIALDSEGRPHNPLINSGAILLCALHAPEISPAERINEMLKQYKKLCGGETLSISMPIYSSEKEHADRNYALAYFLKENKCFPENIQMKNMLDYYFQLCSIEINCHSGAVMAATLANGGVCPITGEKVYSRTAVRDVLTLMHTCGMYDLSGEFSYSVGLPAKSGVSGAIVVVIPDIMGLCLYGPLIDKSGNSVKGVTFCKQLVDTFHYHIYDRSSKGVQLNTYV